MPLEYIEILGLDSRAQIGSNPRCTCRKGRKEGSQLPIGAIFDWIRQVQVSVPKVVPGRQRGRPAASPRSFSPSKTFGFDASL
jgi:hypothetical protein